MWPPPKVALPDALLGERLATPVTIGNAPMKGSVNAPVEVIYFSTLVGMSAGAGADVLEGLLASYGPYLRIYAKVIPVVQKGQPGPLVAEAALFAHAAGKFWPFHDAFVRVRPARDEDERLDGAARAAGLDPAELRASLNAGRYRSQAEGEALRGIRLGDYAFAINGRLAEGNTALLHLVEAAIRKAGKKPPPWPTAPVGKDPGGLYGVKVPAGMPAPRFTIPFAHLSPRQTFAVEPRDEAWAAPIEKELGPLVEKDLRAVEPKLAGTNLECRSTICRLSWKPGKGDSKVVAGAANFIFLVPGGTRPGGPNELFLILRATVAGQERGKTADGAIASVKSRRSTVLYNVRTGRMNPPASVPAERLPKE
jgi:hypothetical protein